MTALMVLRPCSRWLLAVLALCIALQLTACGDKEGEQRKAFVAVLQTAQLQQGGTLPGLSDTQKSNLGPYVKDYAVLTTFSQQVSQGIAGSLKPMLDQVAHIRTPQDYLTQRDALRSSAGAITLLGQQLQTAKSQADAARKALKQPDEVQVVYERVYAKTVSQPSQALAPLIPIALAFSQQLVQVGDYLQAQGSQVTFNGNQVQFATPQQAVRYNELVAPLPSQQQDLMRGLQAQPHLLTP